MVCRFLTRLTTVIGLFKRRHPECYTIADCGRLMGGKFGEGFVGFMYWLMMTAIAGSGLIGVSTAYVQPSTSRQSYIDR